MTEKMAKEKERSAAFREVLAKYDEKDRDWVGRELDTRVESSLTNKLDRQTKDEIYRAMAGDEVVRAVNTYKPLQERKDLFENFLGNMVENMDASRLDKACRIMQDKEIIDAVAMYRTATDQWTRELYSTGARWFSKAGLFLQDEGQTKEFVNTVNKYYRYGWYNRDAAQYLMYKLVDSFGYGDKDAFVKAARIFGKLEFVDTITTIADQLYKEKQNSTYGVGDGMTALYMIGALMNAIRNVNANEETATEILGLFNYTYKRYDDSHKYTEDYSVEEAANLIRHGITDAPKEILQDAHRLKLLLDNLRSETDTSKLHTSLLLLGLARDNEGTAERVNAEVKLSGKLIDGLAKKCRFKSDFDQGDGERAIAASVPLSIQKFVEFEKRIKNKIAELNATDKDAAWAIGYEYTVVGSTEEDEDGVTFGMLMFSNWNIYCYDNEFKKVDAVIRELWNDAVMNYAPREVMLLLISPLRNVQRK